MFSMGSRIIYAISFPKSLSKEVNLMRGLFRTLSVVMVATVLVFSIATTSSADQHATATKRIVARVMPNVSVSAASPNVPEIQTGRFLVLVPFRIDANKQNVQIQICATNLYKADDPSSEFMIPVDDGRQVSVVPANGIEVGDGNNHLPLSRMCSIGDFKGFETVKGEFESSQRGHFSQDVLVDVTYKQGDPELPIGDYSGFVQMKVWIDP